MAYVHVEPMSKKRSTALVSAAKSKYKKLNKTEKTQVKKIVNAQIEQKYFDSNSTISQQFGSGAGLISSDLTAIGQGDQVNQRTGVMLTMDFLRFQLTFECQATNPSAVVRCIVFQWKLDTAVAAPVLADILDAGPSAVVGVYSTYNFLKRRQYRIMYDKILTLNGNTAADHYIRHIDRVINLRKKKAARVNYAGNAVTTGDHHLFMWILGSNTAGVTGQLVTINNRLFFKDA